MTLRWNPDGLGKKAYPKHLVVYAKQKRMEFYKTYALCAWIGYGLGLLLTAGKAELSGSQRFRCVSARSDAR